MHARMRACSYLRKHALAYTCAHCGKQRRPKRATRAIGRKMAQTRLFSSTPRSHIHRRTDWELTDTRIVSCPSCLLNG
eukprot:13395251-Alexandrium_andersonii.AAC.1